jgi:hypothetical protein
MRYRYVWRATDRHGKRRNYYRSPHGDSLVRLPDDEQSAEFERAYDAAKNGVPIKIDRKKKMKRPASQRTPLTGVYLLLVAGKIVYVGTSRNMPARVAEHQRNGRQFDQWFYIGTKEGERLALETLLLRLIRPVQNTYGIRG